MKKNQFFIIFSKNTVDKGFKLYRNVSMTIIYNFSLDIMLGKCQFLDLTAVNMRKKQFSAICLFCFQLLTTYYNFYSFLQRFATFHKLFQLFNNLNNFFYNFTDVEPAVYSVTVLNVS